MCSLKSEYLIFYKVLYGDKLHHGPRGKTVLAGNSVSIISRSPLPTCQHTSLSTSAHSGWVIRTSLPELLSSYIINASFVAGWFISASWPFLDLPIQLSHKYQVPFLPFSTQRCTRVTDIPLPLHTVFTTSSNLASVAPTAISNDFLEVQCCQWLLFGLHFLVKIDSTNSLSLG